MVEPPEIVLAEETNSPQERTLAQKYDLLRRRYNSLASAVEGLHGRLDAAGTLAGAGFTPGEVSRSTAQE